MVFRNGRQVGFAAQLMILFNRLGVALAIGFH
jgi:hypothetical protein